MNDISNVIGIEENQTARVINWLFRELRENFRAFKLAWPTKEEYRSAKIIWLKVFVLAGINQIEQIQHGLNKCYLMNKDFVPSPGEFLEWCIPSIADLGLPDIYQAHNIAVQLNQSHGTYSHPHAGTETVLRHVIKQIGASRFRSMTEKESYKVFGHYYTVASRDYAKGLIQEIPKALQETKEPSQVNREKSDAARNKAMSALRDLGLNIRTQEERQCSLDKTPEQPKDPNSQEWPKEKITKGNRQFDEKIFNEYKRYLLSLDEAQSLTLPRPYAYDRMRFLSQLDAEKHVESFRRHEGDGYGQASQRKGHQQDYRAYSKGYK